ncbi:hypothetical protein [Stenotrophomonas sp. FR010]|uniref:hypothetical protein n=1 Tax=Stenotrophomonas sp. FR010 TaxID=3398458 RepID=UPI0039C6DF10
MPAPELTVKVPGETADTSAAAAGTTTTTPPDERLAAVLTLSKQTVAVITEALPGLVAGDLIALRDLEVAGSNRKGVLEAIEAEDARRAAIGQATDDQPESLEAEVVRLRAENEELRDRVQQMEVEWAAQQSSMAIQLGGQRQANTAAPVSSGQAVLTPDGWVVPEPQPKA